MATSTASKQQVETVSPSVSKPQLSNFPRSSWSWPTCIDSECHELQALIVDHAAKRVLLQLKAKDWILPGCLIPFNEFESRFEPSYVIPIIQECVGSVLSIVLMRQAWVAEKRVKIEGASCSLEKSVLLMEVIGDAPVVGNDFYWVPMEEATVFHLFEDAVATIQSEIKMALQGSQPPNRLSWQLPAWFSCTSLWMERVLLDNCDARLTESISVCRSSQFGTILLAKTSKGQFFLKCTAPDANDATRTEALANITPLYVAKPVVIDADRQLMVTADYGDIPWIFRLSKQEKENFSRDYARLQKATIGHAVELINAGFPDCRPSRLYEQIDALLCNDLFKELGDSEESAENVQFFCENTQRFKKELQILLDSNVPATVTHNDLAFTNIYRPAHSDRYMFFDWVDGFVGHPFTSAMTEVDNSSFLDEWKEYGSTEHLKKLFAVGLTFRPLIFLLLRLQEASARERQEAEQALYSARNFLMTFLFKFR